MDHSLPPSGGLALLFLASVVGSSHCVAMCGPYVAICSARLGRTSPGSTAILRGLFLAGRIAVYAAIGALAGAFGQIGEAAAARGGVAGTVSLLAGTVAILFALSTAGLIAGPERWMAGIGADRLARAGAREAFHAPPYASAILLGGVQGILPCSLVYAAAASAAGTGSAARGALTMLVFGLGTIPAILLLILGGSAAGPFFRFRRGAAIFLAAAGLLLVLRGLAGWGLVPHSSFW